MQCDHTVSQLVQAGAVELPSGQLELEVGKCFFRSGLLKPAAIDDASGLWDATPRGKFDEATISVRFRVVGDLASLSQSEVSIWGPSKIVMIPAGPPERAEVFDTVAGKISTMVKSCEVRPVPESRGAEMISEAADRFVSLIKGTSDRVDDGELMALGMREFYDALMRAKEK